MKICIHPTFQKSLQRKFIFIWVTGVISFAIGLFFQKSGFSTMGWIMIGVFGVTVFGGLAYLSYSQFHVICLACNGATKTKQDSTKSKWVAVCKHCQIEWDLQLSVGSD